MTAKSDLAIGVPDGFAVSVAWLAFVTMIAATNLLELLTADRPGPVRKWLAQGRVG
jgi:hypothetical protein